MVAARPFAALYHPGYLRLTCGSYDSRSSDLAVHLTNQFVQKRQEEYAEMREDTVGLGWREHVSGVEHHMMCCNVLCCGVMCCDVVCCDVV